MTIEMNFALNLKFRFPETDHRLWIKFQVEEELRGRIDQFEERMRGLNRDLEIFMKKDPPGDANKKLKLFVNFLSKKSFK